jgi:hypothetical protein
MCSRDGSDGGLRAGCGVRPHPSRTARAVDAKWPTRITLGVGAGVAVLATFLVGRSVGQKDWIPSAVAAVAGWFTLVALLIVLVELGLIWRHGPKVLFIGREPHNWRQPWIPPAVLVAGILLGWWLFK